ncbi:MAG: hypothetical protein LBQ55_10585 [Treponema sp.]|jgi:hypothetical protein|nr:hypothetical protein [Treponema sp.]
MSLFCFLWMPLFYLFWRSVNPGETSSGGVWALLLGSVTGIFQFLLGSFVNPGGFGFSRWLSGFVDIVSLPVLIPLMVYFLFVFFKVFSGAADFSGFALLWTIPVAAIRAVSWSSVNDPILLVLVPLLWTSIAVGIPFFVHIIINGRIQVVIPSALAIPAIPVLAATVYWAFFSQRILLGFGLLAAALILLVVPAALAAARNRA